MLRRTLASGFDAEGYLHFDRLVPVGSMAKQCLPGRDNRVGRRATF